MFFSDTNPRKGMPDPKIGKDEFKKRFKSSFKDKNFDLLQAELDKMAEAA